MSECTECGEPATHIHPEYPGDKLCDTCIIAHWDGVVEYALSELRELVMTTGLVSYALDNPDV